MNDATQMKYIIRGGRPLKGTVAISGFKNAADGILPAAIMVPGEVTLENIPDIRDVLLWLDIFRGMNVAVETLGGGSYRFDSSAVELSKPPYHHMRNMRASYYLLGALLGRFGEASVSMPGGCDFGERPIDQHIKAFEAMGAVIDISGGIIHAKVPEGRLHGAHVFFDKITVGGTINALLGAALADGRTVLENCAREPHIVDVANFLNTAGAKISGAGTDVIRITGVDSLHPASYSIIPDQIEAGTYMVFAAATQGDVTVTGIIPKHLETITAKLREAGVACEELDTGDAIRVTRAGPLAGIQIKTAEYPGFPTDMQPQIVTLMTTAGSESTATEGIYENRFRYCSELGRMGANVTVNGRMARVSPVSMLTGAAVSASDLRAGAALVTAGLMARGITEVENILYIERGYENIVDKLTALGANILRVPADTNPADVSFG